VLVDVLVVLDVLVVVVPPSAQIAASILARASAIESNGLIPVQGK
jgi:hypothetical protein